MEETKKKDNAKESKNNSPKCIKVNSNSIIILRHRGCADVNKLEETYAEKFGCKVIILESNLDYVGKIDG